MKMLDSKSGLNDDLAIIGDPTVKMAQESWSSISSLGLQDRREINELNSKMTKKISATGLQHNLS